MWTRSYLIQDTPKVREKIAMNRLIAKARHMRDRLLIPGESNKLKEFIKALEPYVIKEEEKA